MSQDQHDDRIRNALTIDVEDYYQVSNFERDIPRSSWHTLEDRVEQSTRRLLSLLERFDVRATFYIVGHVAENHPELVSDIAAAGHEIGSHSYWHRRVFMLSPEEFREDLCRSRDVLHNILGYQVRSFRSPTFSITDKSLWAFEILAEEGFELDSSVLSRRNMSLGIPDAPSHPFGIVTSKGLLREFPTTVMRLGQWKVPIAGGGYFRLYPLSLTTQLLQRLNRVHSQPFVFYTHPWEYDPGQPRLTAGTRTQRFKHYVNLEKTEQKLSGLLSRFRFGPLGEAWDEYMGSENLKQAPLLHNLTSSP